MTVQEEWTEILDLEDKNLEFLKMGLEEVALLNMEEFGREWVVCELQKEWDLKR